MPSLHEVQNVLQRALLRDADAVEATDIIMGAGLAPNQRLDVHRNTIVQTLTNALRLSFPAVHRLVGADFFEAAAQVFTMEQPPRSADLNTYGGAFPDFLQHFEPAAMLAYLPDVARLEWAVNRALHAADAEPLALQSLAAVAPGDHPRVRFMAHPSVSALRSSFPVDTIWRTVLEQDDAAMARINLDSGPVHLIAQRVPDGVAVVRVDEHAWRVANALFSGEPLGVVLAAETDVDAPVLLAQHLAAGRFVAFELTGETP